MNKKRNFLAVTILVITFGGIFFFLSKSKVSSPETMPSVKTLTTSQVPTVTSLEVAGFIRGENRANISPLASGKIIKIIKHEGETVRSGELLAIIESNQADTQVSATSANIVSLKKTLTQTERYYDQLVKQTEAMPSSNQTDEAVKSARRGRDLQIQGIKNQIVAAEGGLQIAQSGKGNFNVIAPFNGTITAIYGREGGFANFSSPLIGLSTTKGFEIETYVSAKEARAITLGSNVLLHNDKSPLSGIVTTIAPGSDSMTLKTLIKVHINTDANEIYLGDFLQGEILLPTEQNAISIPRNSLVSRGGDLFVFVLDENNVAHEQAVKLGREHDGLVDITEGLYEGQKIVIEGQQYLINGIKTKPYATN